MFPRNICLIFFFQTLLNNFISRNFASQIQYPNTLAKEEQVPLTEEDSVCFNNCSGHGTCSNFQCTCFLGFHGDDCRYTFAEDKEHIFPILTQGHFNLTQKELLQAAKKEAFLVVGFSSYSCHKCIMAEPEYRVLSEKLKDLKIPFARVDADKARSEMRKLPEALAQVPMIVIYRRKKSPSVYEGPQLEKWMMEYITKVREKGAYRHLRSVEDVMQFLHSPALDKEGLKNLTASSVVGFFSDPDSMEEDEMEEFKEAAQQLQTKADIYFARVTKAQTIAHFKKLGWIDRTPSVLVVRGGELGENERSSTNLDELYGDGGTQSLKEWVLQSSVPLVGEISGRNFGVYEKLGRPMLMMFLNLEGQAQYAIKNYVPGKSGNLSNNDLIIEFKEAAREHIGRISFVYADGISTADQMKSLGLFGGAERLPAIAFNTKEGKQIPFPEILPINRDTLLQFCADFLSGRLLNKMDAEEMAKKALMATNLNRKNIAARKERKKPPEEKKGISEQWKATDPVVEVTSKTFEAIAMDSTKDVVLLFYAKDCESCSHMTPYYKRIGLRFQELGIPTLLIARMDLTNDAPPPRMNVLVADLPLLLMLPAHDKNPPYRFYSGISKPLQIMLWAEENASIKFKLPEMPHLNEEDREQFKIQVKQREDHLAEQRAKEEVEMKKEEDRRKRYAERKKKKDEQEQDTDTDSEHDEL